MGLGSDTKLMIDSGGRVNQVSLENQLARPRALGVLLHDSHYIWKFTAKMCT